MELFGLKDKDGKEYKLVNVDSKRIWIAESVTPEPEFKVGDWIIRKLYDEHYPERITSCDNLSFDTDNSNNPCYFKDSNGLYNLRHAFPKEIESHLRRICDEKYMGKKVKDLRGRIGIINAFSGYLPELDSVIYRESFEVPSGGEMAYIIYEKGKFAEIIKEKKKLPKNREEFRKIIISAMAAPYGTYVDDFLDEYDYED